MSCDGCTWYRLEEQTIVDYEGSATTYRHVCYKESGCPDVRTVGTTIMPPPECADRFPGALRREKP